MSILGLYSHQYYDPPEVDDDDQDDQPAPAAEALTVSAGLVWWTASAELPDTDD